MLTNTGANDPELSILLAKGKDKILDTPVLEST